MRIIANRLWWLIKLEELLDSRQFGFIKKQIHIDSLLYLDYLIANNFSLKNKSP